MIANRSRSVSLFVVYALVCVTAMVTVKGLWQTNNGNGWTETIRSDRFRDGVLAECELHGLAFLASSPVGGGRR